MRKIKLIFVVIVPVLIMAVVCEAFKTSAFLACVMGALMMTLSNCLALILDIRIGPQSIIEVGELRDRFERVEEWLADENTWNTALDGCDAVDAADAVLARLKEEILKNPDGR